MAAGRDATTGGRLLDSLAHIASDLRLDLPPRERYRRLTQAIKRAVPCDAAALLRWDGEVLSPVATTGLLPDALTQRYDPGAQPRLARALEDDSPVRFGDCDLPDPFDGLLADASEHADRVHACMGAALRDRDGVIGVLALDAVNPGAFDGVGDETVAALAALGGASMRAISEAIDAPERPPARRIVGHSEATTHLREEIALVAPTDVTVLVTGETGTGKELVARSVHRGSRRADRRLVYVNCAALPETLAESELFGHLRGAFTGASGDRAGRFEAADGGTLFLDEVGELPPSLQPKLLRVLQTGELQRVGCDEERRVDVRVVAATNRDLQAEVSAGRFRADLFHRLSVYPLHVAPLRERIGDIPVLAEHLLAAAAARTGAGRAHLSEEATRTLLRHRWPGNVRELEHVMARALLRARAERSGEAVVLARHLGLAETRRPVGGSSPRPRADACLAAGLSLKEATDGFKRELIRHALEATNGNWSAAARHLGVQRGNLHRLGKRLGLLG
ncbi:MAG: nitric oxide reductase transcriptional regulator NorR [Myxococcota bacterium]